MPEQTTEKNVTSNLLVIVERLDNLKQENAKEHAQILEQTTKTNGKVAAISKWQERLIGAMIILNLFAVPIIVAICIEFIIKNLF